jgi:HD-GYP domain-containing protein (c-di-GMP phosphodiesterase class II)
MLTVALFARQVSTALDNARLFGDNAALVRNLEQKNLELKEAYDSTIEGWSRALDLRDHETEGHAQRVMQMTVRLAQTLKVPDEELVHLKRGALLHDIGKMAIPDSVLLKPGDLDANEWTIMRKHPELAYEMLAPIPYLNPALEIPYCHHERWDGSGYPRGLRGEEIPFSARIFAVVDVWDALCSDRPYRPGMAEPHVRRYLDAESGKLFDPRVVRAFLEL